MSTFSDFKVINSSISVIDLMNFIEFQIPIIDIIVNKLIQRAIESREFGDFSVWTDEMTNHLVDLQDVVRILLMLNQGNQFFDKMIQVTELLYKLEMSGFLDYDFSSEMSGSYL